MLTIKNTFPNVWNSDQALMKNKLAKNPNSQYDLRNTHIVLHVLRYGWSEKICFFLIIRSRLLTRSFSKIVMSLLYTNVRIWCMLRRSVAVLLDGFASLANLPIMLLLFTIIRISMQFISFRQETKNRSNSEQKWRFLHLKYRGTKETQFTHAPFIQTMSASSPPLELPVWFE